MTVQPKYRPPLTEAELAEMRDLYERERESMKDLGTRFRISELTVKRHLSKMGIQTRSKSEQRAINREKGRENQSEAIKAAWRRGAYASLQGRPLPQPSPESLERMEAARRNRPRLTPEHRALISARQRARVGAANSFFGRKHSAETRHRLSELARQRAIPGHGVYPPNWQDVRERVLLRDGSCQVCGSTFRLEVHHIDLDRGKSDARNLLTLCSRCHLGYHGRGELVDEIENARAELLERLGRAAC